MKPEAITPLAAGCAGLGVPRSGDTAEPSDQQAGALAQTHQGWVTGSGLPGRWRGRERFVVLQTGFGQGGPFLATWTAWRADPQRCEQLVYIAVDAQPLTRADLEARHLGSTIAATTSALIDAWPPATPDLHRLVFEGGAVTLLLAFGACSVWLPALQAQVDVFYLDGVDPAGHPGTGDFRVFKAIGRLAAPRATAATRAGAVSVGEQLVRAGFDLTPAPGAGAGAGEAGRITLAHFAPRFVPKRPPARRAASPQAAAERRVLVVGAGLAGCACVAALAAQGWRSTLIDRGPGLASEASGNPAGIFHGIVHAGDGPHARFYRACALEARRSIAALLASEDPAAAATHGSVDGLLRLETGLSVQAMRGLLVQLGLPAEHVQALDQAEASVLAGLSLSSPAWLHHAGGWVRPRWLAEQWRDAAGPHSELIMGTEVGGLERTDSGWSLLDGAGRVIAAAPVLVLANALAARQLLAPLGLPEDACPLEPVRGQISLLGRTDRPGLPAPLLPLVGSGYLLPMLDGKHVFGASAQPGDLDPSVRNADHRSNLERLAGLSPALAGAAGLSVDALRGRTGWRCVSRDRLPLIGAVPEAWVGGTVGAWDRPRFVPRATGLYVCIGLGSRGITVAALAAELLAATLTGAPLPLPADLVDAVDPARFLTRATRRRAAVAQGAAADR